MNKCLNCNQETNNAKFCSISCQLQFQNEERCNKRYGIFKNFIVRCDKCGVEFITNEREKLFPQKEKYYCSRKCANSKIISKETKELIRKSLQKSHTVSIICKQCNKNFEVVYKRREQLFCSKNCAAIWRNTQCNRIKKSQFKIKKEKDINKITFIYTLEYPMGDIRYVGKSDFPQARLKDHIKEAKQRNKSHKDKWINSLGERPILNIIEETTYEHWQNREIFWIKYYKDKGFNLVNGTDGGEGSNGFLGRIHTTENRKKFSNNKLGTKSSQETIKKLSGENNGRCKLKDDEVRNIFHMFYHEHKNYKEIADKHNINKEYVRQIISGRKRKNIFNEFNNIIH